MRGIRTIGLELASAKTHHDEKQQNETSNRICEPNEIYLTNSRFTHTNDDILFVCT